jgi:hypothetical protein
MKKILGYVAVIILLSICATVSSFASTKYDVLRNDPGWKKLIIEYDKTIAPTKVMKDYLDLLINKNDLIRIAKSGALDKEKSKFISDNLTEFLKFFQGLMALQIYKEKWQYTDAQMLGLMAVIKDPHAQAAKNAREYEMEKEFWRSARPYALWEHARKEGSLEKLFNDTLDKMYMEIQNEKKGK